MNIVLIGFMGAGKTSVGKELAKKTGATFMDFDEYIEKKEGRSITKIFQQNGEAYFRELETRALDEFQGKKDQVFATGGGMVLRQENQTKIKSLGKVVWLDVSLEEAMKRTFHETHRPMVKDNREAAMQALWDPRQKAYAAIADLRVLVDGKPADEIAQEIINEKNAHGNLHERLFSAIGRLEGKTISIQPGALSGTIQVPASKSVTHRALICAALSKTACRVSNALVSDDTLATAAALKVLGCRFEADRVDGKSLFKTGGTLSCGESGSTLRFLMPLACLGKNVNTLNGTGRLLERPVQPLADALNALGGNVETSNGHAPVHTRPGLVGGTCTLPGNVSSQFVSALLMALPACPNTSTIRIKGTLQSRPYVDVTLDVMRHFGVHVREQDGAFLVEPQGYNAKDFVVPTDWSSAAFFLAAGAIGGDVTVSHIQPDQQADAAILVILKKMGAQVDIDSTKKNVRIRTSTLFGVNVDVSDFPDLVPILAVTACFAKGKTKLYNAARLRLKESDRLTAITEELKKMGGNVDEEPDALVIHGGALHGANVQSHNDHRIAMALSVAAAFAKGTSVVNGADCVSKSYPGFYHEFRALGGKA